jgi:hypothetical protein
VVIVFDIVSSRIVAVHGRHGGAAVTAVAIDSPSGLIVSGDASGAVVIADPGLLAEAPGAVAAAAGMPTALVGGLEPPSPVVQLQIAPAQPAAADVVCAVSTTTRAHLLRVPASLRGAALAAAALTCIAVGKKPRDGDFGAAFELSSYASPPAGSTAPTRRLAFSARPAKRIWVVDVDAAAVVLTVK